MGFKCPECNEEVYYDGEDVYCEACGLVLNRKEVFCPQCGGELIHAQGEYGEIIVCSLSYPSYYIFAALRSFWSFSCFIT